MKKITLIMLSALFILLGSACFDGGTTTPKASVKFVNNDTEAGMYIYSVKIDGKDISSGLIYNSSSYYSVDTATAPFDFTYQRDGDAATITGTVTSVDLEDGKKYTITLSDHNRSTNIADFTIVED